jgi:hypothetical protein
MKTEHNNKFILTTLGLVFCLALSAQNHINHTRIEIKQVLQKQYAGVPASKFHWKEYKDSLTLSFPEGEVESYHFSFSNKGICQGETIYFNTDSAYNGFLKTITQNPIYHFIKINENQYVSDYEHFLLIELPAESPEKKIGVFKTSWTKSLYEFLMKSK